MDRMPGEEKVKKVFSPLHVCTIRARSSDHFCVRSVGEATVSGEAAELEMTMEKYIQDLERALTGAGEPDSYSFSLSPEAASGGVTLTYEKMQKEISVRQEAVFTNSN